MGVHVASLNLFREADGYYITVAGANIPLVKQIPGPGTPHDKLAGPIAEGAARFLEHAKKNIAAGPIIDVEARRG